MGETRKVMTSLSEDALALEAKNGSLPAFDHLVRLYDRKIYAYCRYRVGHSEDARDLTQQTFIQAFRKMDKFRTGKAFSPWLFTIARNLCTDFLRQRKNTDSDEKMEWIETENPATQAETADNRRDIWQVVRTHVDESEFTALWLVYQLGFNMKETAYTLKKSVGATKVILSRARQRLRNALEHELLKDVVVRPMLHCRNNPTQPIAGSQS
jgi:RNA polymerase sigma-70 factor (ECF subfamily)